MKKLLLPFLCIGFLISVRAQSSMVHPLDPMDIFDLKYVGDPQISPNGDQVAYLMSAKDVMTDSDQSSLWIMDLKSGNVRPVHVDDMKASSPRWSEDGKSLMYRSSRTGRTQVYIMDVATGNERSLYNFSTSPSNLSWSPDGTQIAFTMAVPYSRESWIKLPSPPAGAKWTSQPVLVEKMKYRADGAGYSKDAWNQLFVMPASGGQPRQITKGSFSIGGGFTWDRDGKSIVFSANHRKDAEYAPSNTELHRVNLSTGNISTLTDRLGPDGSPRVSPDGKYIAYTGLDEEYLGYQINQLYLMDADGQNKRLLSKGFDRQVGNIQWASDGQGLFFQYDTEGNTRVAHINLKGEVKDLAEDVGGLSIGRPYGGGTFTVAKNGWFAFTHSRPDHPSDLAIGKAEEKSRRLTNVNAGLFSQKTLGEVEEIWYESSYDGQKIQGWICKPPGFDPNKKYPLLLEIHGGPFANYGDRFSMEVQLYAAAGYVVLYTNPRGSSSYGKDFGNLIHHNYPNQDYDDLITGVDEVIKKGYIDEDQLYVTGGSGGGVLTAWIVGKTDRFRAAVVAKPVINWYSFVLHADNPAFFSKYWFPGLPWENAEHYMKRSPISLVGNVKTPTMLLTGELDYRTPMSETEQYYAALKLQKVETAMVRIQNSGHGIASKPSNLMNKVLYILAWFEKHKD